MKNNLLLLALLFASFAYSQQFTITGIVADSTSRAPLQSATVFLESKTDSTLITYSITDVQGAFNLTGNTGYTDLNFFINFQGYQEYSKDINFGDDREIDLGTIYMNSDIESLSDVVVTARKAPVTVKQDTLEFNAKSFNTRADATLEDVIKELPGVDLDKDGNITVNGKQVTKILVNGKEFFGDDPQVALKNLPKEIIDKIQVTDSKTDEQKLSGDSGDENASEINITIDEDKNKGWFSRLTAGAGTDDRYSMSGIVNYFKEDLRISVLGSSNNINSPGFSFDEIYDAMGGSAYSISRSSNGNFGINGVNFGAGDGITSSRSAGLSIANEWNDQLDTDGNYFYGSQDTRTASDSRTVTFLPDRTFTTLSSSNGNVQGDNHRFGGKIEIKPDTLTSISIRPNVTLSNNRSDRQRNSRSLDQDDNLINRVTTSSQQLSDNSNASLNIYSSRRLSKKGSYLSLSLRLQEDEAQSDDLFNSNRITFNNDSGEATSDIQNQLIQQDTRDFEYSISPSYRQAIDSNWYARVNYQYSNRFQESQRDVFDLNPTGGADNFNELLSNDFEVDSDQHRPSVGIEYDKGKFGFRINGGLILQSLESDDALQDVSFDKNFENIYLQANVRKQFGKFGRIYANYRNSVNVPSVRQLQPVEDRTNPTNIIVGNPDLNATVRHDVFFNISNYNWEENKGFYMGGNFNLSEDAVAAITTTDADLIRTTTYRNVDGNFTSYLYGSYSKSWKKDQREIGGSLGINVSYDQFNAFTNGVAYQSNTTSFTPDFGFEYSIRDIFDLEMNYNIDFNNTAYDIATIDDQEFVNQNASIDLTTFWPENVTLGLRGEYNKFGNVSSEFDNDSFVLIGSLGYKFAKDKAIVKLKAYDILDQVINTRRVARQDFVSDTSQLVLQQYFMLSFTYKLSKFGGKDPNDRNGSF
jgi:hypothetical protein